MDRTETKELLAHMEAQEIQLRARNADLQALTDNLPGGVFRCYYNPELTILQASNGFLKMFGYTREELREWFQDSFWLMMHPDDREKALADAVCQLAHGTTKEIEYRVVCKDGGIVSVLDKGQLVKSTQPEEPDAFYCILIDVTETKRAQEELQQSLERHEIILSQSNDIIFEWDMIQDTLDFSPNFRVKFGYDPICKNASSDIRRNGHIAREDIVRFDTLLTACQQGRPYMEEELRILNAHGHPVWCRVRMSVQCDTKGRPIKAVGVIVDINSEKRRDQRLRDRAERDTLTGSYNRGTIQAIVHKQLEQRDEKHMDALLIIDVDNFKQVNDTFGHLFGDAVLSAVASGMKKFFIDGFIGRIGGDEFLVYQPDAVSQEHLQKQAERILQIFRGLLNDQKGSGEITCSIGVALCPKDGDSFQQLYHKADIALYEAKHRGKSCYVFYDEQMLEAHPGGLSKSLTVNAKIDSERPHSGLGNQLVEYIFGVLYESNDTNRAVGLMLEIVGKQFDVSRVYIFETDEDGHTISNTFEWCGEGIKPEQEHLQRMSLRELDDYYEHFNEGNIFYCRDIEMLPESQAEVLRMQGIKAVLQCAIRDQGELRGFVGFDECGSSRFWTQEQVDALTLIAEILSTFLMRQRAQERLKRAADKMELVLENQNTWIYAVARDNFELLYINGRARALVPGAEIGMRCYQAFFGRDRQCEHCPVRELIGKELHSIEVYNPLLDVWTMADAGMVCWDGRDAVLLTCHDITRYKRPQKQ